MMTKMYNPPHPGLTLKEDSLPALELTVTEASEQLGVTRAAFSRVINGKAGISPEMALRTGSTKSRELRPGRSRLPPVVRPESATFALLF